MIRERAMSNYRRLLKCVSGLVIIVAASATGARATNYPTRPIAIITPAPVGSGPDVIARITAAWLEHSLKQQVVILNRPGGGGLIGARAAARIRPDGYTLYMPLSSTFVVLPVTHPREMPLDLNRDLVPIGLIGKQPMIIAVNHDLGVRTMAQLEKMARERSHAIFYGSNAGSLPSLTAALLQTRTGMKMTFVPYANTAKATQDTASGTLQLVIESSSGLAGPIQAGDIIPLAIAAQKRVPELPDLPTVEEALPSIGRFEARGWIVLMARAGTPNAIVQKLRIHLQRVLSQPELRRQFATLGTYVKPMPLAELKAFIDDEQKLWRPLVKRELLAKH